jgi:hypothetical protein
MRIYVACGLTHVPRNRFEEYAAFIHALAGRLEGDGHEVNYALRDSDPQLEEKPSEDRARLCYVWDREMVESAELIIAEVSFPSLGVGIELQVAETEGVPALLAFLEDEGTRAAPVSYETPDHKRHILQIGEGYVTLMALGLPNVYKVLSYREYSEAIERLAEAAKVLAK